MTTKHRAGHLTTTELYNLDAACSLLRQAFHTCPYLVGSSNEGKSFRDVDVRLILDDEHFDSLFGSSRVALWELLCLAIGDYLRQRTGLPIDFQIQSMSEANQCHKGVRNPLGLNRTYAGGGDGTPPWTC